MKSRAAVPMVATTIAGSQGQRQPSANELEGRGFKVSSLRRPPKSSFQVKLFNGRGTGRAELGTI